MLRFLCFAVLAMGVLLPSAQAYLLPADFIIRQYAEMRRELRIRDVSVQLNAEVRGHEGMVDEHLYLKYPERMRLVQEDGGEHVYIQRESNTAAGPPNALKRGEERGAELLPYLLMPRGRGLDDVQARLMQVLREFGIDTQLVSLSRLDGKAAYVLGARPWEPEKPQVWFDKKTLMPVRYVVTATRAGEREQVDTRLLDYGSDVAGKAFPRVVEEHIGHDIIRRAEVVKLQTNKNLPETLFDLPRSSR